MIPKIIERIPRVRRYANVAGRALDQWTFEDRVTLLGDAAHTHGGAFAAGASLAIDDAYTLSLAFDEVFPATEVINNDLVAPELIGRVLDLYERIRRPHTARVLAHVHDGRAKARSRFEQSLAGRPESDSEFRNRIATREDPVWLTEHDAEKTFIEVVAEDRRRLKTSPGQSAQVPQRAVL